MTSSKAHRCIRSDLAILFVLLVAAAITSWLRGQDNWWDVINYHIYNPWALLNHRWGKDLFAAGIQSYFHPLIDVPYYLAAEVWFPGHPGLVSALAGLPYGFLAFASYLIARRLLGAINGLGRNERVLLVALTVLLSVTGVSAWTQAGTTTNEVTISALVLFGLVAFLKLRAQGTPNRMRIVCALATGTLLGTAAGLKLTSAIYAPGMGLVLLATSPDVRSALRDGTLYFVGWVLAFALIYGPWAWHLFEYTGNPFFPMFNNIFHSTFSAPVGGRDMEYMPKNLWEWLFYPAFWLNAHKPSVYNRLPFRDGRILFFYIMGIGYFIVIGVRRLSGRVRGVPRSVHVVTLFCALSYVIWLFMFSMLRYGIVLEVLASIAAIALFVSATAGTLRRRPAAYRVLGVAAIVSLLMVSTVYPDVPRIGYSRRVYTAHVPDLPRGSLVVLANQPMGLLAPLIQNAREHAVFVGLPSCFEKHGWCFNGFYHYGLGREMRRKIEDHHGPIYVAYYKNRSPVLPQLRSFRLRMDRSGCNVMTTNTTPNVALCRAHYVPVGQPMPQQHVKAKLQLKVEKLVPGAHLEAHWLTNECGSGSHHGELRVDWHMPTGENTIHVFLKAPPTNKRVLFAGGGADGSAKTGLWVKAEQTFLFVGRKGRVLARATTRYVPCNGQ